MFPIIHIGPSHLRIHQGIHSRPMEPCVFRSAVRLHAFMAHAQLQMCVRVMLGGMGLRVTAIACATTTRTALWDRDSVPRASTVLLGRFVGIVNRVTLGMVPAARRHIPVPALFVSMPAMAEPATAR
jgi:hypothetical protein